MSVVNVTSGTSPIILCFPHMGTQVPVEIWNRLNENGRTLADTDWHVDRLYEGLLENATTVQATFHRYVIDANRDPAGGSLYPGKNTTDLVPLTDFDGTPIWRQGQTPTERDVAERVAAFHSPYHAALEREIERVKALRGIAVVYDCHSIRSRIAYLFEGTLPDFNIGTNGSVTCHRSIENAVVDVTKKEIEFTTVSNGRFKGGWTTRQYGRPVEQVHAIQMELAQSTYLKSQDVPFEFDEEKAEKLRTVLRAVLIKVEQAAHELKGTA